MASPPHMMKVNKQFITTMQWFSTPVEAVIQEESVKLREKGKIVLNYLCFLIDVAIKPLNTVYFLIGILT